MNPDDPRAQRTRDRLRAALRSLAAEHELRSLTIAAVAREAGVNRATVYQHYGDLDALVADTMESAAEHVARCADHCPLDLPSARPRPGEAPEGTAPADRTPAPLVDLFEHVAEQAVLYRRMLSDQGSARFAHMLRDRLTEVLAARFAQGARPPGFDDVPARLHAAYLAGALVGVVSDTVLADGAPEPQATAAATWRLLRG
ncbi:TetR family transcriptional regulator [Nocardiopsis sp. Huas11]|uniref:TetR/AcrR family transcriptional regulator n=1 Tax=Nocardiopsis sp. Huas11 TaxID=2183912 RepID=UPI000EB37A1B|nr:TetR/AcrR family transcriptional regulator [Nocardiopsis sp. Huas11]RKS05611.1 TetR family transcriptional regulator [Nocardiopsis sp. Huas11]